MTRNRVFLFLFGILALCSTCQAFIEGEYNVKGYDPYEKIDYTGEASIRKDKNDVYQMDLTFNGLKSRATGMKCCEDTIAFIALGPALIRNGRVDLYLTIYKIQENTLKGKWVLFSNNLVGEETLTKK